VHIYRGHLGGVYRHVFVDTTALFVWNDTYVYAGHDSVLQAKSDKHDLATLEGYINIYL